MSFGDRRAVTRVPPYLTMYHMHYFPSLTGARPKAGREGGADWRAVFESFAKFTQIYLGITVSPPPCQLSPTKKKCLGSIGTGFTCWR